MNKNTAYSIVEALPTWVKEVTPGPGVLIADLLKSHSLAQVLDLKRRIEPFERKYKMSFPKFQKKVKSQKKENFELWDDYIVWEGLHDAYQLWNKRYKSLS